MCIALTFAGALTRAQSTESTKSPVERIVPRPLLSAFSAMEDGRWDVAAALAERDGPAAAALIEWFRLSEGLGKPEEIIEFLEDHGDWPGLERLRRRSELIMVRAEPDQVIRFFEDATPRSGLGALNYARALERLGRKDDADAMLIEAWRTLDLSESEHDAFIKARGEMLKPHHRDRLDMALWRGLQDVENMLPLVSRRAHRVAEARQQIEEESTKTKDVLKTLPKEAHTNAHIGYVLFKQHMEKRERNKAIELILRQSRITRGLGQPARWARSRRFLVRDQMEEEEYRTAYDLASIHGLKAGSDFAELEWLSGYIALRHLERPALAALHFNNLRQAVKTPISLGRAGYWLGRAYQANGNVMAAREAYEFGALHQTSFYGLLAAEQLGLPFDDTLNGREERPNWSGASFAKGSLFKAGSLLFASGRRDLAEVFFRKLADQLNREELLQLGDALEELGSPHLQVMIGKSGARNGVIAGAHYFALHPLKDLELPVPAELSLSIARRESEFNQLVTSGVGAMGLMQLMPATALDMARSIGVSGHTRAKVYNDWTYNARLGSTYLARMAARFDGNLIMMAAAYNAGPSRPSRWMDEFGDPRAGEIDIIDWIESIPFAETRNYVMRIAESVPIYRARLGLNPFPVPFSEELVGDTFAVQGE
ncbi:MAG: lytic transglycosylase domain-containing protein [Pseudomonadota bacterium]